MNGMKPNINFTSEEGVKTEVIENKSLYWLQCIETVPNVSGEPRRSAQLTLDLTTIGE
jgi:hypothetical protein